MEDYVAAGGTANPNAHEIYKIPLTPEIWGEYLPRPRVMWDDDGTLLLSDKVFPLQPCGVPQPRSGLHMSYQMIASVPRLQAADDPCSFVERLAPQGTGACTVTVRLNTMALVEAVGVCLSPWDRYPDYNIEVEVGVLKAATRLPYEEGSEARAAFTRFTGDLFEGLRTRDGVSLLPVSTAYVDLIRPNNNPERHRQHLSRNEWTTFDPRYADCVRLTFLDADPRIFFIYVLGGATLWDRCSRLIKDVALLQTGRATFLDAARLAAVHVTFKKLLKAKGQGAAASLEDDDVRWLVAATHEATSPLTAAFFLYQMAFLECDQRTRSFALHPVAGYIFSFL